MRVRSREVFRAQVGKAQESGLSIRSIAKEAGVHPSFITHLMQGRKDAMRPETAHRIADALGVVPEALFDPRSSTAVDAPSTAVA